MVGIYRGCNAGVSSINKKVSYLKGKIVGT
jgi:hypothetical protein